MANMKDIVLKYALQNAIFYSGRANPRAVLGKVLGSEPGLRSEPDRVRAEVEKLVKEINRLTPEEQQARLRRLAPEMLIREEKKQEELPPLPNARPGHVITRFAPSPTGPLNIAQLLRAAMMNYLYAQKYQGKFVLRLEDTDPGKIEKVFYKAIQDDLKAAGIKWDRLVIQSNGMAHYYRHARELLGEGKAYLCFCSADGFRDFKIRRQPCPHRDNPPKENLTIFHKALKGSYDEGQVVLRLKTSMQEPNPVLRDPPLMRVNKSRHPLKARRFNLWPLYNYACAVDDHRLGITHIFRGKEHEHNTEVQRRIHEALGWSRPTTVNFGMIYLPGEKLHTRDIKAGIKSGKFSGWDDPRLHTVQALLRRGFQPEAFRLYAIQVGLTKTDIRMNWDNLESFNRSVIDSMANRYMVVLDPVRIRLRRGPDKPRAMAELHPDYPKRGKKAMPVFKEAIYISREDWRNLQGKTSRLKSLFNIRLSGRTATYSGEEVLQEMPKIQWVSKPNIEVSLHMPDRELKGLGEKSLATLKRGDLLQMERIGYGRLERKGQKFSIMWTHR